MQLSAPNKHGQSHQAQALASMKGSALCSLHPELRETSQPVCAGPAGVREPKPEISGTERTRSKSQGLMWLACTPTCPPKATPNGSSPVEAPRSPRAATVTQEMRPDVARLGVYPEDALEAGSEGWHRGPVPVQEVIVVLQPVRQHVVGDHAPAPFPHLQHSDLCWYHHSQRVTFAAFTQPGSSGHMRNKPASLPCSQGREGPVTLPQEGKLGLCNTQHPMGSLPFRHPHPAERSPHPRGAGDSSYPCL